MDHSLSPFELIVLARLSCAKPPSEHELGEALGELVLPDKLPGPASEVVSDTLAALRRRELVSDRRNTLTMHGAIALRATFDLEDTPSWTEVRTAHLPARALGLQPGSPAARTTLNNASTIALAVLQARFKLAPKAKIAAVCDAIIVEELGLPPGRVTLAGIRAHMLARRAGSDATGTPKQIIVQIAGATLGNPPTQQPRLPPRKPLDKPAAKPRGMPAWNKRSMSHALSRRWLYEVKASPGQHATMPTPRAAPTQAPLPLPALPEAQTMPAHVPPVPAAHPNHPPAQPARTAGATTSPVPSRPPAPPTAALSADTLLTLVREAIPRIGSDGRFGAEKVFVSAIWERIEHDGRLPELSFDRFKRWLVTANRDQLLDLARADLVGAMDPRLVAESEIEHLGATFHFVVDRRSGAAAAERGLHAR
jgi:hypothetical protein